MAKKLDGSFGKASRNRGKVVDLAAYRQERSQAQRAAASSPAAKKKWRGPTTGDLLFTLAFAAAAAGGWAYTIYAIRHGEWEPDHSSIKKPEPSIPLPTAP